MKLPTIVDITNFQTGEELDSAYLLDNLSEKEIFQLRDRLSEIARKSLDRHLVCSICNQPIILAGRPSKHGTTHYFKHYKDTEECPIVTKNKYSQDEINAIKYNGAKESPRHIYLKEFIYNQIVKDRRFKNEAMEKVVKSFQEKKLWRKPDVSSDFGDTKIVFEIQLQTTYLNVIRDRENFYKNEKIYIMWFFDSSNMEKFRFSEKDIFYANKSNAFVINDETIRLSLKSDKFIFYCYYQTPYINNLKINYEWKSKLITVDDLKFDKKKYKIYYYDLDNEILDEENSKKYPWLKNFWARLETCRVYDDKIIQDDLQYLLEICNIENSDKLIGIIFTLYSIKKQKVIGYENSSIIWLLNNFIEHYEKYVHIMFKMIDVHNLRDFILDQDRKHTFKKKVNKHRTKNIIKEKKYNKLLSILFPELVS